MHADLGEVMEALAGFNPLARTLIFSSNPDTQKRYSTTQNLEPQARIPKSLKRTVKRQNWHAKIGPPAVSSAVSAVGETRARST